MPLPPGCRCAFAATKLVEGDTLIEKALQLNPNETDILGHAIAEMETVTGLDREARPCGHALYLY